MHDLRSAKKIFGTPVLVGFIFVVSGCSALLRSQATGSNSTLTPGATPVSTPTATPSFVQNQGVVTTFAGTAGSSGSVADTGSSGSSGSSGPATFFQPGSLAIDSIGNLYVADTGNYVIRKVTPDGVITTLAGSLGMSGSSDGTGTSATFGNLGGLGIDASGNLYAGDLEYENIRKITPDGVVTTFAGPVGGTGGTGGSGSSGSSGAVTITYPSGIAVDSNGNLFVADSGNGAIEEVSSTGVVTLFAGASGASGSSGGSGASDGTGTNATFGQPVGIAFDPQGNLIVADMGTNSIRKITPGGYVSTLAGSLTGSSGPVGDTGDTGAYDGTGTAAFFASPQGVAVNSQGTIYVTDTDHTAIRQISPTGVVTTLAGLPGSGTGGVSYSDGTGTNATFGMPTGIVVDSSGKLFVSDTIEQVIREIK